MQDTVEIPRVPDNGMDIEQPAEDQATTPPLSGDYTASKSQASMETMPEDQTLPLEIFAGLVGAVILAFIFLKYFRK